jgi:hypothetical protein
VTVPCPRRAIIPITSISRCARSSHTIWIGSRILIGSVLSGFARRIYSINFFELWDLQDILFYIELEML